MDKPMFSKTKIKTDNGKTYNGFICNGCNQKIFSHQKSSHRHSCFKNIPTKSRPTKKCPGCDLKLLKRDNYKCRICELNIPIGEGRYSQ